MTKLLAIGQGIRRLLGAALQVSIEAHFTEEQQVNPLVWWGAKYIRAEHLFDDPVCLHRFTIHLWMVRHTVQQAGTQTCKHLLPEMRHESVVPV